MAAAGTQAFAARLIDRTAGQCTVRTWLFDPFAPPWHEHFFIPEPEPCLACPPIDALERMLNGGLVRELLVLHE